MNDCEFCHRSYRARPQVKNPRACRDSACQSARQRSNEKDWLNRQGGVYDRQYHRHQKIGRLGRLKAFVDELLRCLDKGALLLGSGLNLDELSKEIRQIFFTLGIRRLNKFWKS